MIRWPTVFLGSMLRLALVVAPASVAQAGSSPIPGTGGISGSIFGVTPGETVRVSASAFGAVVAFAVADAQGFHLDGLLPASYRVDFSDGDVRWALDDVLVCADYVTLRDTSVPRPNMITRNDPQIEPAPVAAGQSALDVRVATPNGEPVAAAVVALTRHDDQSRITAVKDPSGTYVFEGLRPGTYDLAIGGAGIAPPADQEVELAAGQRLTVAQQVCPAAR